MGVEQGTQAFGWPGIEPRWTRSDKEGIVCAYSASSPIWAALSAGVVNEVYFPSIDTPQVRDLQFLITDGQSFFHDERRDTDSETTLISGNALGFRIINRDPAGRYSLEKQIIAAPHAACLLMHTKLTIAPEWQSRIKLFALLAPCRGLQSVLWRDNWPNVVHFLEFQTTAIRDFARIDAAYSDTRCFSLAMER